MSLAQDLQLQARLPSSTRRFRVLQASPGHPRDWTRIPAWAAVQDTSLRPDRFSLLNTGHLPASVAVADDRLVVGITQRADDEGAGVVLGFVGNFDVAFEVHVQLPEGLSNETSGGHSYGVGAGLRISDSGSWAGLVLRSSNGTGAVEEVVRASGASLAATSFGTGPGYHARRTQALAFRVKRLGGDAQNYFSEDGGVTWHPGATTKEVVTSTGVVDVFVRATWNGTLGVPLHFLVGAVKVFDPASAFPA